MTRFTVSIIAAVLAFHAPAVAAEVPRKAPEYAFTMPNGKQVLLSQYRGKVVAFGFYFTTCPHCQVVCQLMERLSGQLGAKGFQPLGVAFNEVSAPLVADFMRVYRITFPFGASPRETVYKFLGENPNARGTVPQMVLIDRQGMIRYQSRHEGDEVFFKEETLRSRIEELLREGAGRPAPKKRSGR
jgi:peroxiredoxin